MKRVIYRNEQTGEFTTRLEPLSGEELLEREALQLEAEQGIAKDGYVQTLAEVVAALPVGFKTGFSTEYLLIRDASNHPIDYKLLGDVLEKLPDTASGVDVKELRLRLKAALTDLKLI